MNRKLLEISSFCTYVPKTTIIWGAVPEIRKIQRQNFLQTWVVFCPFTTPNNLEIKILKKWRKHLEISSFDTCVPKTTIIWGMLPEIWSATDTFFLSFLTIFCSFTSLLTQKIKIWKKCKRPGDIILLHMCTINEDHMIYVSWDERRDRHFFTLWPS